VRHHPGALPLLQHALLELWNKREGRRLIVKAYQEIGKLEGALQRRADATLKAFSQDGVPLSLEPHSHQVINDRFLINKTLSKPECQLHQRQT
jgi:conflict system STAND superfamily ATPase